MIKKSLKVINKVAVIRGPGVRECPFGLPISLACFNAGDTVDRMQVLNEIDDNNKEKYISANKRIYRHYQEGNRCVFADKIVKNKNIVNCDWGDTGARYKDTPLRPSPYYPRVFNGLYQTGLFAYPMSYYWDNPEQQQLFTGMMYLYGSTGEVLIQKHSLVQPDNNLIATIKESKVFDSEE